jgi:RING-box protein 1
METKFKIKSMNLLNSWCYNLNNNTDCTICRYNLNCNSIYASETKKESYVVTGMCGHNFHHECLQPWIATHPNCPICSSKWIYKK